jgi:hypothetical protein
MATGEDEIKRLRREINNLMEENKSFSGEIAIEDEIEKVLGILIRRHAHDAQIYSQELADSARIRSQLVAKSTHNKAQIAEKYSKINDLETEARKGTASFTRMENTIWDILNTVDKSILRKIKAVSDIVVKAITQGTSPDFSNVSKDTQIVEIMGRIGTELNELLSYEGSYQKTTDLYISFIFVWFMGSVFSNPDAASRVFSQDTDTKECFKPENIHNFGLPKVLDILL